MNNKTIIMSVAIVLGIVFILAAVVYFITPAQALPVFMPGYEPGLARVHLTHGVGALVLGLGSFVVAWFQSGRKPAKAA